MKKNLLCLLLLTTVCFQTNAQTWNTNYFIPLSYFVPCDSSLVFYPTDSNNIWQSGMASSKSFFGLNGNEPAIMTDSVNAYLSNNHSYFDILLPAYVNYNCGNVELRFFHKMESDLGKDGGYITFSVDQGISWHSLFDFWYQGIFSINFQNLYFPDDSIETSNGFAAFTGLIDDYIETRIEFVTYLPVRISDVQKTEGLDSLWVRFNFVSDSVQTNKAGWIIKDLQVWGLYLGSNVSEVSDNGNQVTVSTQASGDILFQNSETNLFQSIDIYSMSGQIVYHKSNLNTSSIAVSNKNLSEALYSYKILFANGKLSTGKFER